MCVGLGVCVSSLCRYADIRTYRAIECGIRRNCFLLSVLVMNFLRSRRAHSSIQHAKALFESKIVRALGEFDHIAESQVLRTLQTA